MFSPAPFGDQAISLLGNPTPAVSSPHKPSTTPSSAPDCGSLTYSNFPEPIVTYWRFSAKTDQVVPKAVPKNVPNTIYCGFYHVLLDEMVPPERLELPTHWLQISCSTSWAIGALPLENQEETIYCSHSYYVYSILLHSGPILWEHDTKIKVWHNVWHECSTYVNTRCCLFATTLINPHYRTKAFLTMLI